MSTVSVAGQSYGTVTGPGAGYPTLPTGWVAGQTAVLTWTSFTGRDAAGWVRRDPNSGTSSQTSVFYRVLVAGEATTVNPTSGYWPTGLDWMVLLLDNVAPDGFAGFTQYTGYVQGALPYELTLPKITPGFGQQFAYLAYVATGSGSFTTKTPWSNVVYVGGPLAGAGSDVYTYMPGVGVASAGTVLEESSGPDPSGYSGWVLAFAAQQPPNSVTVASPAPNTVVDATAIVRFTASPFTDPNAGDQLTAMDLRWTQDSGVTWTTINNPAGELYVDVPAGTFTDGPVQVQMRPYDLGGNVALWGPSAFFTAGTPAPGPTVTYPVSGQTVGQFDHVDWGGAGSGYWVRVLADDAGSPADPAVPGNVYFDSGPVSGDPLTHTLPIEYDANSVPAHVQVAVILNSLWTLFTDVPVSVLWVPPPAPIAMVSAVDPSSGTITLRIAVGATAPGAPDPESITVSTSRDGGQSVETRQSGIAPGLTTWTHQTPASGVDYVYLVQTVAGDGTTAGTGWFGAA